jgi:excisionase family DNA binding protein
MIDTTGMITVAEAAKRMNRSIEQVRRKLREGKLKGQRVGNQWFVEEEHAKPPTEPDRLISRELLERIDRTREALYRRTGVTFDAVAMVHEVRELDFGEREETT